MAERYYRHGNEITISEQDHRTRISIGELLEIAKKEFPHADPDKIIIRLTMLFDRVILVMTCKGNVGCKVAVCDGEIDTSHYVTIKTNYASGPATGFFACKTCGTLHYYEGFRPDGNLILVQPQITLEKWTEQFDGQA